MTTFNHKIQVSNGATTDTFHPETNTGQVYDFNNATWLSNILGTLSTLTTTQKTSIVGAINEIAGESALSQTASNMDSNGIYKIVEYKRTDNTLYMRSTASNPDSNGYYQTLTWQYYDANGTTLTLTKTWTITYNENGLPISKVVV